MHHLSHVLWLRAWVKKAIIRICEFNELYGELGSWAKGRGAGG